jgi:hypothetical protein
MGQTTANFLALSHFAERLERRLPRWGHHTICTKLHVKAITAPQRGFHMPLAFELDFERGF